MGQGYFVTGTDTGVGKTWAAVALMAHFKAKGLSVVGMKPVASGCEMIEGQLRNSDALLLQQNSSLQIEYAKINPYAYAVPVSPHIAGEEHPADIEVIQAGFESLQASFDRVIVEGAGGWYSPLSQSLDNAGLAKALNLPIILVVAIRLGCINQARLSLQVIAQSGVLCAGWIAVCNDPDVLEKQKTIGFLETVLDKPKLGVIPYLNAVDADLLATFIFSNGALGY